MTNLATLWEQGLPEDARTHFRSLTDLDVRLKLMLSEARAAWPGIEVSDADALSFIAERVDVKLPPATALEKLHSSDLFLSCACAQGNELAAVQFRDQFSSVLRGALARYADQVFSDEIIQQLYTRMLVTKSDRAPDIVKYRGSGRLASWLRIAALREANSTLRASKKVVVSEVDKLLDKVIEVSDPELDQLKKHYRNEFKSAFQRAFTELDTRGRNVLRHQYIEGLNLDRIAALYGVARSTAAYWRSQARESLFTKTRAIFRSELRVSNEEFASVMRLIDSQLEVSMSRILRDDEKPPS